jgi:hypothetical protein
VFKHAGPGNKHREQVFARCAVALPAVEFVAHVTTFDELASIER